MFSQELLRDEWIAAIQEGCSRHYQEAMEAEYDDVSPNHFNKKDEEKDRFDLILQVNILVGSEFASQKALSRHSKCFLNFRNRKYQFSNKLLIKLFQVFCVGDYLY